MSALTPGFIVAHSHRLQDLTDLVVSISKQYPLALGTSESWGSALMTVPQHV